MIKKIIVIFFLVFNIFEITITYADNTVSITKNTDYIIKSDIYNMTIGTTSGSTFNGQSGTEKEWWSYGEYFSLYQRWYKILNFQNTTNDYCLNVYVNSWQHNLQVVEQGPVRILIHGENSSIDIGCFIFANFTYDFYATTTKINFNYNITGNNTRQIYLVPSGGYRIFDSQNNNRTNYWGAGNSTGHLINNNTITTGVSGQIASYLFFFNSSPQTKTIGWHIYENSSGTPKWWVSRNPNPAQGSGPKLGISGIWNDTNTYLRYGYLWMFGQNGGTTDASYVNEKDFKNQFLDYYYNATTTCISGSCLGFDKKGLAYNFTADNNGLLRFNFSTNNNINHTYPIFHIKDATSTASSYKDHIWMKNYSKSNPQWQKLNNWTDFVIQDGNSSYFGYNYILLLINKTLASDYEFWIDNNEDPPLINVTTNKTTFFPNQTVLSNGTFFFGNGTGIANKDVNVKFIFPNGTIAQNRNVTTDSNGYYQDTYTLPSTAIGGTYTVSVTGYYDSITATDSTTFKVLITTLTTSPIKIKTYPEEVLQAVSVSKLKALRNLTYEEVVRTLGTEYEFRIEISEK